MSTTENLAGESLEQKARQLSREIVLHVERASEEDIAGAEHAVIFSMDWVTTKLLAFAHHLSAWVPVTPDTLPKANTPVIVRYGKLTTVATWVPKWSHEECGDYEGDDCDYSDQQDAYFWPEGWYESHAEGDETSWRLTDGVTHWQPLPSPPQEIKEEV